MSKVEIGISKTMDGYQAWFKMDHQWFYLDECIDEDEEDALISARFYESNLIAAFTRAGLLDGK